MSKKMKLNIEVQELEIIHQIYINKIVMPISIDDDYDFEVAIIYEEELDNEKVLKYIDIIDKERCHTAEDLESFDYTLFNSVLSTHYIDKVSDEKFRKKLEDISNKICDKVDKIIYNNEIAV